MRMSFWVTILVLALPSLAAAGGCEDNFVKKKIPFLDSLTYVSEVIVPDLTPPVAIRQVSAIMVVKGYNDVTKKEAQKGDPLLEQRAAFYRMFPINVTALQIANGQSRIVAEMKLGMGMTADARAMKTEICEILGQIKGGEAGTALATYGAAALQAPVDMFVARLASQIEAQSSGDAAAIQARYSGKRFRLTGKVQTVIQGDGTYSVLYDSSDDAFDASSRIGVQCRLAPSQSAVAVVLKPGEEATLIGRFDNYDSSLGAVRLVDCMKGDG